MTFNSPEVRSRAGTSMKSSFRNSPTSLSHPYYIQLGTQLENPVLYEQCSARFLLDPYLLGLVETLQSGLPEFKIL